MNNTSTDSIPTKNAAISEMARLLAFQYLCGYHEARFPEKSTDEASQWAGKKSGNAAQLFMGLANRDLGIVAGEIKNRMNALISASGFRWLAAALILCVILHALSTRYSHIPQGAILDRWTGKLYPLKLEQP